MTVLTRALLAVLAEGRKLWITERDSSGKAIRYEDSDGKTLTLEEAIRDVEGGAIYPSYHVVRGYFNTKYIRSNPDKDESYNVDRELIKQRFLDQLNNKP